MSKLLDVLRRIIQEVNEDNDFAEIMDKVVTRVRDVMETDACSIYLFDEQAQQYRLSASIGFMNDGQIDLAIATDQGLIGLISCRGEPLNLENASTHPNYRYYPETGEERYKAFLGAPIIHRRQVLGILVAQQTNSRRFEDWEEAFLVTVSAQLASVLAHAHATGRGIFKQDEKTKKPRERSVTGLPVAAGVSMGEVVVVYPVADFAAVPKKQAKDLAKEHRDFKRALDASREELTLLAEDMQSVLPPEEVALFEAYLRMLDDASLGGEVVEQIDAGWTAQTALKKVIKKHVRIFEEMEDEYLRDRAIDIKDLGRRVLKHLQKDNAKEIKYPKNTILVGEEVTASLLAEVPNDCLCGIVSLVGSKNSHVAILARALGIPVVMGAAGLPLDQISGQQAIVDGYTGRVYFSPRAAIKKEFKRLIAEDKKLYADLITLKDLPAVTSDGVEVPLLVNTGILAEAPSSLAMGADGVGLYRSEVPFLARDSFPTEEEQRQLYRKLLESYHPRSVAMRTLDIGGDKSLPYFPVVESNPYLGWRGIRISLDHPELLLVQLRAMIHASEGLDNLRILLPMVTSVAEVTEAVKYIAQAHQELIDEGFAVQRPQVGAMIEVPSAVYQVDKIAAEVDFISIGTNDLTQYILAVDRNNERVAYLYDSLHPAVLRSLYDLMQRARAAESEVAITACGEMASDPMGVVALLALGVDAMSMSASRLLVAKWVIRSIPQHQAKTLLHEAMQFDTAEAVRHHLQQALDAAGLGGLTRAGK